MNRTIDLVPPVCEFCGECIEDEDQVCAARRRGAVLPVTNEHPERPEPLPLQRDAVAEEFRERDHWVCWRYEWHDDEWTKVPRDAERGGYANAADPETWTAVANATTPTPTASGSPSRRASSPDSTSTTAGILTSASSKHGPPTRCG